MFSLCTMADEEVSAGMRLSTAAGWNQTPEDWKRVLKLSRDGCFVAKQNKSIIGTVATVQFGSVAWIGMMLVDSAHRRQGVGRALMERAMEHLSQCGVESMRLDATDLGRPLYEKLGFVEQFSLTRCGGKPSFKQIEKKHETPKPNHSEWRFLFQLDRRVVGADRYAFLNCLFSERPDEVRAFIDDNGCQGFITTRMGRLATYIGPCIAITNDIGQHLLRDALWRYRGQPVMVDIANDNTTATNEVQTAGLTVQRSFVRMTYGKPSCENIACLFSSSGPEKG